MRNYDAIVLCAIVTQELCAIVTQELCANATQELCAIVTQEPCANATQELCAIVTQELGAITTQHAELWASVLQQSGALGNHDTAELCGNRVTRLSSELSGNCDAVTRHN